MCFDFTFGEKKILVGWLHGIDLTEIFQTFLANIKVLFKHSQIFGNSKHAHQFPDMSLVPRVSRLHRDNR